MSGKRDSVALFSDRWNAEFEAAGRRVMLVASAPRAQTSSALSHRARVMPHGAVAVLLDGVETAGGRPSDACKPCEGLVGLQPTSPKRH